MNSKIALQSSHLLLESDLVAKVFEGIQYAYAAYEESQNCILVTPVNSVWFTKIHKPAQFLLKMRNFKGDRSLAIREILLDNDLDTSNRLLDYEVVTKTNLIKIYPDGKAEKTG